MRDPARLRAEIERARRPQPIQTSTIDATKALAHVEEQQKRLTRLFVSGELPDDVLKMEARRLKAERDRLERELKTQSARDPAHLAAEMADCMPDIAAHIAQWVRNANRDDLDLLLRALDIHIQHAANTP